MCYSYVSIISKDTAVFESIQIFRDFLGIDSRKVTTFLDFDIVFNATGGVRRVCSLCRFGVVALGLPA